MAKKKSMDDLLSGPESIKIACKGADNLPLDAIEEFQGELKKRTREDIEKIQKSIIKYGFSMPFFIWNGDGHNYCIDGHGRIKALEDLRKQGYSLPLFPVIYIKAENEIEAKQKLLLVNSHYGNITQSGMDKFIEVKNIDFDLMNFTISAGAIQKSFQQDKDAAEKAVTFPVIISMNMNEYRKIKSLKERLNIKKDEQLVQKLIEEALK